MANDTKRRGKPAEDTPDSVLRDILKIAGRLLDERAQVGDPEELAMCVAQLDEMLGLGGLAVPKRWSRRQRRGA